VWTSSAIDADFGLALVRTRRSERYHAGLSMVIIDLSAQGVDIRPLRQMTGESTFSEVFIEDVSVPTSNLLGAEGEGWAVLTAMLRHERIALSAGTTGRRMDGDAFPELVSAAVANGAVARPEVRDALVDVYIQQRLLDLTGVRIREALDAGLAVGPVGSIAKVGTALGWRGEAGFGHRAAQMLLRFPMTGIAGGTTEIQKNTIAERILGLPREPRP
jgi:alkylation response protein AidB-like acyl-CoA dehydrogenase